MNNESTIQNLNATKLWCISPQDRLFLGEALIETLAVRGGTAQHSLLHWQRLQRFAVLLGYSSCPNFEVWQLALQRQIHQDNLINGGVKVVLTGGIAARGLSQQGEGNQLLVQTFTYEQGIKPLRLMRASWQRDANNPLYQIKAMSYLEGIFAQRQAHEAAVDDVLFFNQNGYATETSCANLFVIYRNRILTPPVTDGVVSGIIRTILLTQSQNVGLTFIEQSITIETLEHAQAVFVTNSLQGVQCVETLDDMSWSTAHPLIKKIQTLLL